MPKITIPEDFLCPITHEIMKDPVATSDGQIYERQAIEEWLKSHNTSPLTNIALENKKLTVIPFVKNQIEKFIKEKRICTQGEFFDRVKEGVPNSIDSLNYFDSHLEAKDHNGYTPLCWAAHNGTDAAAEYLLNQGALIEATDDRGHTPLIEAAEQGHQQVMKVLLDHKANVNANIRSHTALHRAAYNGHEQAVKLLLSHHAKIEAKTDNGSTPLHFAAATCNEVALNLLLTAGAQVDAREQNGCTALHKAAGSFQNDRAENVFKILLSRGLSINDKDNDGLTPFHHMALITDGVVTRLLVEPLLSLGADIDALNNKGETALHYAIEGGLTELVKALIKQGANIEIKTHLGNTPLHTAVQASYGSEESIRLLLDAGANPKEKNNSGQTAAELALAKGKPQTAQLIAEYYKKVKTKLRQLPNEVAELRKIIQEQQQTINKLTQEVELLRDQVTPSVSRSVSSSSSQAQLMTQLSPRFSSPQPSSSVRSINDNNRDSYNKAPTFP